MTDRAYQELKEGIIKLRIPPGEQLDAGQIGSSLGFSRAPVVEALNLLRNEGLVVSRRRVGTFVAEIGKSQIGEMFDAREMIEQRISEVIIHNVSNRQIEKLDEIIQKTSDLFIQKDGQKFEYSSFMELDATFHREIIQLAEHKIYQKWFDELEAHMRRVRFLFNGNSLERSKEGQKEHEQILDAIRMRNIEELKKKLLNHTRRSRESALDILNTQ